MCLIWCSCQKFEYNLKSNINKNWHFIIFICCSPKLFRLKMVMHEMSRIGIAQYQRICCHNAFSIISLNYLLIIRMFAVSHSLSTFLMLHRITSRIDWMMLSFNLSITFPKWLFFFHYLSLQCETRLFQR